MSSGEFEEYLAKVRVAPKEPRHVCRCANAPHTHHLERGYCQCRCGRRSQDGGILWYVEVDSRVPPGEVYIRQGDHIIRIINIDEESAIRQAPCARDFGTEPP